MELRLFLRNYQIDSCFIFSLMNYNKLDFQLYVESSLSKSKILEKDANEQASHPHIIINQKNKETHISKRDEILKFLLINKLVQKGVSHSAWEQQTFDYLIEKTYPLALGLPVGITSRLRQTFRMLPRSNTTEFVGFISRALIDAGRLSYADKFKDKLKKTKPEDFTPELDEWTNRLAGQDFHGGDRPDKADFMMFSIIESNWIFLKPLFKSNIKIDNWKVLMNKCAEQESRK